MKIEIDEQKILTGIIERDSTLHEKIKDAVEKNLIQQITSKIESKYLKNTWGTVIDEIDNRVLEDIAANQTSMVKKILKEFYESYRYKKSDLAILKELKSFIGE